MNNIDEICKKYVIKNYTINNDGSIDVDGDVFLYEKKLTKIPLKFNYVSGSFYCNFNELTSLEGCPKEVGYYFNCGNNYLTSLEFGPERVGGSFYCHKNELTSLEFSPERVGIEFNCTDNEITNLYGISGSIGKTFYCNNNPIGSIFNEVDIDFITAFNVYKVIKDNTVNLKRLKYVMELFERPIDLEEIKKFYTIS